MVKTTTAVVAIALLMATAHAWDCADKVIGADQAVDAGFFKQQCGAKACTALVRGGNVVSATDAACVEAGDVVTVAAVLTCSAAVEGDAFVSLGLTERASALRVAAADADVPRLVATTCVATGAAATRARIEFLASRLTGNCSVRREGFAVAAPTVLPLAYAQAAAPVDGLYAAETVRADGAYVYALDAASPTAALDAGARLALRNASFPQGSYLSLADGAALVWDHCAQLARAAPGSRPTVALRMARGLFPPSVAPELACAPAGTEDAWTVLRAPGHGTTTVALPDAQCCRVRLTYAKAAADPEKPPYWTLHAYTLTAPLDPARAPAPAHDYHGAQLVFVPTSGDVVRAALDPQFAAAPPALDYRDGARYAVPVVLESAASTVVEVRTAATNVAVADAPAFINIEGLSHALPLTLERFDLDRLRAGDAAAVSMEFWVGDTLQGAFELRISGRGAQGAVEPSSSATASCGDPSPASVPAVTSLAVIFLLFALSFMH